MHVASSNWVNIPFKMIKSENIKAIDRAKSHIVTGFDLEKNKVRNLVENFNTEKEYEVYNSKNEVLGNDDMFSTGTKLKIGLFKNSFESIDGTEKNYLAEYNVVVYGDTTGDGKINAIDALALIKHLNGIIPFENEVFTEAGRIVCEEGAEPTAVDALAIIKHANKKISISQIK